MGRSLCRAIVLALMLCADAAGAAQAQELERVLQIGVVDGPEEYTFGSVADAAFGPAGELYVLDGMNGVLRVFDADGVFVRSFGRKGSGPGEFQFPTRLVVTDSSVRVLDPVLDRQAVFTHAGEHVRTTNAPSEVAAFDEYVPLRHGRWIAAKTGMMIPGALVGLARRDPDRIDSAARAVREEYAPVVAIVDPDGQADTIFRYDHGAIQTFAPSGAVGGLSRSWGAGGSWAVSGDSMFALIDAFEGDVVIMRMTEAGPVELRRGRVPITPRPLTEQDWRRMEDLERAGRDPGPRRHLSGPLMMAQLGEPVFADDGTLWIPRLDHDSSDGIAHGGGSMLLVPTDGRAQSSVRLPDGFSLRAVRGNELLGVRRTELDVSLVEVWRYRP